VYGHHAFSAEFDANQPLLLKGTITGMEWVNPHAWLHIDVKNPDGKVVNWSVEFSGATALYKKGWRKEMLPIGLEVTAEAFRAKNPSPTAHADKVTLPDGRQLLGAAPGADDGR
jgi:hypothetical protein